MNLYKELRFIIWAVISFGTCIGTDPCDEVEYPERKLIADLFSPSDHWQRPVRSIKAIEVSVSLMLAGIQDIIERQRTAILHGYFDISWYDEFHIWNETFPYNCTPGISVPSTHVWLPDICLVNSADRYDITSKSGEYVYIHSDGTVHFWPGGDFEVYCDLFMELFPLDSHTCTLHLESWMLHIHQQVFSVNSTFQVEHFIPNAQWDFLDGHATVPESISKHLERHMHDRFYIKLTVKRKFAYYAINIIFPSIIIASANCVTFMLPPDHAKRLAISITCLLAMSIFQRIVASEMPRASDHPPLILVYFVLQMGYICLSMIGNGAAIFVINKTKPKCGHKRVPEISSCLFRFLKVIGYLTFYNHCVLSTECKWKYVAGLIEHTFANAYILLSTATALAMLVIYPALAGSFNTN